MSYADLPKANISFMYFLKPINITTNITRKLQVVSKAGVELFMWKIQYTIQQNTKQ